MTPTKAQRAILADLARAVVAPVRSRRFGGPCVYSCSAVIVPAQDAASSGPDARSAPSISRCPGGLAASS